MTTETKKRNQILKRIERMPEEQLTELDKYLKMPEAKNTKKSKVLSYAGAWKDLDDNIFREFTEELIVRRQENKRRSDEKSND
ncbi:MAG: hypothetical protein RBR47_14985 [Bacteroidales bacterium]|jgi:hypothetical protein|nr:hypothetical protein [Bacteroidales bacterium]NCU35001.1 hypothetical protein [Candidatus Falkowbacteria bacterium]MDD3132818.1 hypothetical protein [Bacteroidales bacterium]MDD3525659.1 hypothetical protein [Bacteroidales bacterium]MDD4177190.1 hypothetical protein [Bacteroidales bacterium]